MTLLLTLTAGLLASEAVPDALLLAVEQVESSGRGASTPAGDGGKAIGPLQFHRSAWTDVSAVRRQAGLKVWPYSFAADPMRARAYALTWLTVLKIRLAKEIGRPPLAGEIWLAWNLGWTGFRRYGFQWARVPDAKFDRARTVNRLTHEGIGLHPAQ